MSHFKYLLIFLGLSSLSLSSLRKADITKPALDTIKNDTVDTTLLTEGLLEIFKANLDIKYEEDLSTNLILIKENLETLPFQLVNLLKQISKTWKDLPLQTFEITRYTTGILRSLFLDSYLLIGHNDLQTHYIRLEQTLYSCCSDCFSKIDIINQCLLSQLQSRDTHVFFVNTSKSDLHDNLSNLFGSCFEMTDNSHFLFDINKKINQCLLKYEFDNFAVLGEIVQLLDKIDSKCDCFIECVAIFWHLFERASYFKKNQNATFFTDEYHLTKNILSLYIMTNYMYKRTHNIRLISKADSINRLKTINHLFSHVLIETLNFNQSDISRLFAIFKIVDKTLTRDPSIFIKFTIMLFTIIDKRFMLGLHKSLKNTNDIGEVNIDEDIDFNLCFKAGVLFDLYSFFNN